MNTSLLDAWFARLEPALADYHSGHFQLGRELRRLVAVREAAAVEAVVFYGARVLEALSGAALEAIQIPASVSVFSNLLALEQYSLLTTGPLYSAHALRRLGNTARHIQGELTPANADVALVLTERILTWFFLDLRRVLDPSDERPLRSLCRDQGDLQLAVDSNLRQAAAIADDAGRTCAGDWEELARRHGAALLSTAVLPAMIAELWLGRGLTGSTLHLLRDALVRHPDDSRLLQLQLLALSRQGDLQSARERIDLLMARNSEDEETLGIAAGVYKRIWRHDPAAIQWLSASHKLYRTGWKQSKQQNAYLGINAATTALWHARTDVSRRLALEVEQLLRGRAERLRQSCRTNIRADFWTQATLAEALLLQGRSEAAAAAFHVAGEQYPDDAGSMSVARTQMYEIARALAIPAEQIERLLK